MPRVPDDFAERVHLAATLAPQRRGQLVTGTVDAAVWLPGRFVYRVNEADGSRITVYELATGETRPARARETLALMAQSFPVPLRATAPNGKATIERDGDNLVLIDHAQGDRHALTTDGTPERPYGTPRVPGQQDGASAATVALWSPDSTYVISQRLNVEGVRATRLTESAPAAGGPPREHTVVQSYPGDAIVPEVELIIFNTKTGDRVNAATVPFPCTHSTPLMRGDVWWQDGLVYAIRSSRDWRELSLEVIDPATGVSRTLVRETSDARLRPADQFHLPANVRVLTDKRGRPREVIWFSEREGWGHLYLYRARTGKVIRRLTHGELVRSRLCASTRSRAACGSRPLGSCGVTRIAQPSCALTSTRARKRA